MKRLCIFALFTLPVVIVAFIPAQAMISAKPISVYGESISPHQAGAEGPATHTLAITTSVSSTPHAQDETDTLLYLPLIFKPFDPTHWHTLDVSHTATFVPWTTPTIESGPPLTYTVYYTVTGAGQVSGLTISEGILPPWSSVRGCGDGVQCNVLFDETGTFPRQIVWNLGDVLLPESGVITGVVTAGVTLGDSGWAITNTVTLSDTSGLTVTQLITTPVPSDVALVFDMSGSMQWDTICYGCYEPFGEGDVPWTELDYGYEFPRPEFLHPIPTAHLPTTNGRATSMLPSFDISEPDNDMIGPPGSNITIRVYDHLPAIDYILHFTNGTFTQTVPFTPDALGTQTIDLMIDPAAPLTIPLPPTGSPDYRIYTVEAANPALPIATCENSLTNAPCFSVGGTTAELVAKNINRMISYGGINYVQFEQPLTTARWPVSSSIPIYLFGHDVNTDYTILFDGQPTSSAPGAMTFLESNSDIITTDSQFGFNQNNEPAYYVAAGHTPAPLTIQSRSPGGSLVAGATVELTAATIEIAGETPTTTHPEDDVLTITLRNHAPLQEYKIFFDDGVWIPLTVRVNADGENTVLYAVPHGVQEPGTPPLPVNIYTLDYGRGPNPNIIARRTFTVVTPIQPYLNIPGGATWSAGSPLQIQLRRHPYPPTTYAVYLQQGPADNPTFSQLINGVNVNLSPSQFYPGLGEADIAYTLPQSYTGFYTLRSFAPDNLTTPVAQFDIQITPAAASSATEPAPADTGFTLEPLTASNIPDAQNLGNLCWGRDGNTADYLTLGGGDPTRYVVIEAELYSKNNSVYGRDLRQPGQGYWAVQHTNWRTIARMLGSSWDPDASFATGATPIWPTYSRGSWVTYNCHTSIDRFARDEH